MDEVAAVAGAVAPDERRERARPAGRAECLARSGAAQELEHDRPEHEGAERVGDEAGQARAGAQREEHGSGHERYDRGPDQAGAERAQRAAPPRDERPDPHQQQQRQAEHAQEEVEVGRADGDRLPAHSLGEQREGDSP